MMIRSSGRSGTFFIRSFFVQRSLSAAVDAAVNGFQPRTPSLLSVYSFESRQYERLTNFGWGATWLSDSRRLLFQDRGRLCLVDSQSKKVREVLSVAPHGIGMVTVSRDDRLICFSVGSTEADIWLMTLE